jgi:hypothetical protein
MSPQRRFLRDVGHLGISLVGEAAALISSSPGYCEELIREGLYSHNLSFRKLPIVNGPVQLDALQRDNPHWDFREDFDPNQWVFVFLHGYVDNTGADRIAFKLAALGYQVYLLRYPFLKGVRELGNMVKEAMEAIHQMESGKRLVPVGHSLGGFIWDEVLLNAPDIVERYRIPLYLPLGSPHFGTLAAYVAIGQSAQDMRPNSDVVRAHRVLSFPDSLEVYSIVSRFDMLVVPIETALLKSGINYILSETGHIGQVISSRSVLAIEEIISTNPEVLLKRSTHRQFYPSSLCRALGWLPSAWRRHVAVDSIFTNLSEDSKDERLRLRVVHREMALGVFPRLNRPKA